MARLSASRGEARGNDRRVTQPWFRWRSRARPLVDPRLVSPEPARPEPLDQNAVTVPLQCRLVRAQAPAKGRASRVPARAVVAAVEGGPPAPAAAPGQLPVRLD